MARGTTLSRRAILLAAGAIHKERRMKMTEQEKRQHRCCFTGHRPEKLNVSESFVIEGLEKEIRQAIADGMNVFITGMARGTDIWAALIVLSLREENLISN